MPMDAQAIREMFGQTVLWVCGVGLCGLAAAMVGSCLCRIPACVLAKARRYGWLTVTVIGACMAFAAIEGAVTRAYKERYAGALVRDGASTNRHESARMEQVKETHAEARRGWGSGTDSCDGEGAVATNPSAEESRTLTDDDFARGFALTRIGTNETFGFSPPEGAEVCADWRAFGAAEDWMYLAFADWAFRLGTDEVDSIRVHSGGWVEASPAIVSGAQSTDGHDGAGADLGADNRIPLAFLPLKATLGIVPEANWPLVAVSGDSSTGAAPEAHAPSRFWHSITPSNTLVLTWQNAFLGRDASKPVSFQAEFWGDGRFAYRYGIPSLGTEAAAVSNVLVGASLAGLAWAMDGLPANVTSLSFHPLVAEDTVNPDTDGDGLPNAEEYALDTDPSDADSDGDGIPDGDEAGWPQAVRTVAGGWASVEGGWTEVALEPIEGMPAHLFEFGRPLTVGDEAALDAMCQWNGLILVETDRHGVGDVVDAPPQDMSGPYVSDAALAIAPFWTGNAADCPEPSIGVFMRGEGGNVAYAIQYGGDGVVPTQTTLTFTNGAYMAAEIVHGHFDVGAAQGFLASVGVQDAVGGRRWSADHGMCVPMAPSDAMRFVSGMGTDPAVAEGTVDTDGDGLSDALERQIGTDPSEPDTDGDGMHDGWEHSHGFNPKAHNGRDGDPLNDADADPDGDGLANREEADWGTDPHNDDTDGDGVPDGVEVEQSSDPADASDGGRPASRVPVAFTFGDPSGSHSEKYRLVVKPSKNPGGRKPASGEEPKAFDWVNAEYGECETKTAMLLRGWTYEVRMSHAGTDPDYDGSPRPDYDYWLSFSPPSCVGVVTNDPQRLFGENGNMGETFEAEGKVAEILVLDGCIVGDYDRIDGFSGYDLSRVYRNRPLRHWINDDDDEGNTNEGDGDIPGLLDPLGMDRSKLAIGVGREPDYFNNHVDGRCDVLDFMPVWIDVGRALKQLERTGDEIELTLSNDDGAVNVVWTSLSADGARRFLTEDIGGCGESLTQRLKDAKTIHVTEDEIRLPKKFVEAMRDDSAKGVILVEGRAVERSISSSSPLKLRFYRKPCTPGDGSHIFEMSLPLSISPVEDMFRWVDERWVCGDTNGIPSRMGLPWNNPDSECDGRHFVFVHGYSVSAQSARGWASEMFKRLWQSGSRAMFTAVDWYGDDSLGAVSFPPGYSDEAPNYYVNVEHAFATASRFARDCAALEGQKVLLAHSLGNMLVSSAIKDHGLTDYARYYMLNAAVPMEAYDRDAHAPAMVDHDWRAISNRVYASEWWSLFPSEDGRRRLSWRERFDGIPNAVNCYSRSEDTLGDAELDEWLIGKRSRKKYWALQEILKGTEYLPLAPDSWGIGCEGGWGYNPHYATNRFYVTWPNRRMTARFRKRIANLTQDDLIVHPVFRPFFEDGLLTTNVIPLELVAPIRARILADGIPATSFAAGANPLGNGSVSGNINYATCKSGEWPRKDGSWRHSDIKNIAFRFNWKFFKKLVEGDSK